MSKSHVMLESWTWKFTFTTLGREDEKNSWSKALLRSLSSKHHKKILRALVKPSDSNSSSSEDEIVKFEEDQKAKGEVPSDSIRNSHSIFGRR